MPSTPQVTPADFERALTVVGATDRAVLRSAIDRLHGGGTTGAAAEPPPPTVRRMVVSTGTAATLRPGAEVRTRAVVTGATAREAEALWAIEVLAAGLLEGARRAAAHADPGEGAELQHELVVAVLGAFVG